MDTIVITVGSHMPVLEHTILEAGEVSSFFCADSRWSGSGHFLGRMGRRWRWAAQAMGTSEPVIRVIGVSPERTLARATLLLPLNGLWAPPKLSHGSQIQ